jgi:hypothetical protein
MSSKQAGVAIFVFAFLALGLPTAPAATTVEATLSEAGKTLEAGYAGQLTALQAEITAALPALEEGQKVALQKAREAVKAAEAGVAAAQQPLDKLQGARALVDHAKGKWIGGAEKGIAAAEAALKKATTDAEREAAKKDLAQWQANKEDGLKALAERQAALDKATADAANAGPAIEAAKAALAQAQANEIAAAKALLARADSFLSSDKLDAALVKCVVLANAKPRGLAEFAQQGKEQEALVTKLLGDPRLMKAMLEAGGARDGKYGPAMQIYTAIQKSSPRATEGTLQRLALATSLEHAVPIAQNNPAAATNAPKVVDPVKRYLHFEKAFLAGELDPAFKDLSAWELRNVVNGDESDETLAWGREMLRNYRPDHVLNPDFGWRYSKAVATDVRYGSQNVKDDLPTLQSYQNIIKNGGVCGRRAFFGRFILRSFGIPTLARPQRGHAALARWTPDGWVVNLGAGWGYPAAKGVMGMTDTDFLLETQARKNAADFAKSLRAQWAGEVLGEPKYDSMKPFSGGVWSVLAQFEKKAAVAGAKPVQQAALGTELGEANESAEVRARALVAATVTDADKKVVIAPGGAITIPAAACGGAQVLGSFLGGHQLFSGGGVITCDIEVPAAGAYELTARVVTVHDNPKMQLAANGAKEPVEIAVPYTVGQWEKTPPVQVALVQGKNSLQFTRPEGSRGLTVKDFTLTPVK